MRLFLTFLPVLVLAGCASTSSPSPEDNFKRADTNGNGSVSRSEATNLIIADAFAMYDANGDGAVTEAEYLAAGGTSEGFRKVNTSGDGKVSLAEAQASPLVFNTFVVSFDEADADNDGYVTLAEYQSYLEKRDAVVR